MSQSSGPDMITSVEMQSDLISVITALLHLMHWHNSAPHFAVYGVPIRL